MTTEGQYLKEKQIGYTINYCYNLLKFIGNQVGLLWMKVSCDTYKSESKKKKSATWF